MSYGNLLTVLSLLSFPPSLFPVIPLLPIVLYCLLSYLQIRIQTKGNEKKKKRRLDAKRNVKRGMSPWTTHVFVPDTDWDLQLPMQRVDHIQDR